jgi:hypothetical protein
MQNSEIIATKVHGWVKDVYRIDYATLPDNHFYVRDPAKSPVIAKVDGKVILFDPENNDTQAIAALEAWLAKDLQIRDYEMTGAGAEGHCVTLTIESKVKNVRYWDIVGESINKSLSAAIVEALCSAVGEVK